MEQSIEFLPLEKVFIRKKYLHVFLEGSKETGGFIYAKYSLDQVGQDVDEAKILQLSEESPEKVLEVLGKPLAGYEAFLYKERKEIVFKTAQGPVVYPPCIPYPSDSDFGHSAWAPSTLENARLKIFNEVEKRKKDVKEEEA